MKINDFRSALGLAYSNGRLIKTMWNLMTWMEMEWSLGWVGDYAMDFGVKVFEVNDQVTLLLLID